MHNSWGTQTHTIQEVDHPSIKMGIGRWYQSEKGNVVYIHHQHKELLYCYNGIEESFMRVWFGYVVNEKSHRAPFTCRSYRQYTEHGICLNAIDDLEFEIVPLPNGEWKQVVRNDEGDFVCPHCHRPVEEKE